MQQYNVGDKIITRKAFTTPIGRHIKAGEILTVVIGGTTAGRSIKLSADLDGSVVWISDGLFLVHDAVVS
jgi:hypothetical protein